MQKPAYSITFLTTVLVFLSTLAIAQKQQRVLKIINKVYLPELVRTDSLNIHYTGDNGSVFKPHLYLFGPNNNYGYINTTLTPTTEPQPAHDMPEPVQDLLSIDTKPSYIEWTIDYPRQPGSGYTSSYTYDYNKVSGISNPWREEKILLNESGLISCLYTLSKNNNVVDTIEFRKLYYNNEKKVIADTTFSTSTNLFFNTLEYTYNAKGQLTTLLYSNFKQNIFDFSREYKYTYDTQGHVVNIHTETYEGSGATPKYSWDKRYIYTPEGNLKAIYEFDKDTMHMYSTEYTLNTNRDPDTVISLAYHDSNEHYITVFFYNDYHNPDSVIMYRNNRFTNYWVNFRTGYTYETYGNGEEPPEDKPMRKPFIYPIPARDIVNIRWHKDFSLTPLNIKLYNAAGQQMRTYNIPVPRTENDINTSGLAPGVYLLRINTTNTNEYIYSGKLVIY